MNFILNEVRKYLLIETEEITNKNIIQKKRTKPVIVNFDLDTPIVNIIYRVEDNTINGNETNDDNENFFDYEKNFKIKKQLVNARKLYIFHIL